MALKYYQIQISVNELFHPRMRDSKHVHFVRVVGCHFDTFSRCMRDLARGVTSRFYGDVDACRGEG